MYKKERKKKSSVGNFQEKPMMAEGCADHCKYFRVLV